MWPRDDELDGDDGGTVLLSPKQVTAEPSPRHPRRSTDPVLALDL